MHRETRLYLLIYLDPSSGTTQNSSQKRLNWKVIKRHLEQKTNPQWNKKSYKMGQHVFWMTSIEQTNDRRLFSEVTRDPLLHMRIHEPPLTEESSRGWHLSLVAPRLIQAIVKARLKSSESRTPKMNKEANSRLKRTTLADSEELRPRASLN